MYAVKRQLIDWLKARPELNGIQVEYVWPGHALDRECVYGGKPTSTQKYAVMTSGRKPRDERSLIPVRIEVIRKGAEVRETDERVEEIAAILENLLADNVTLGGSVSGLRYGGVVSFDSDWDVYDETAESTATLEIEFSSRLF